MSLSQRMADWVDANGARLRELGPVTFRRSDEERAKPSAHLVVHAGSRLAEMIVWDSGEVELTYGTPDEPHDEHHEVDDPAELDRLLEQLVDRAE